MKITIYKTTIFTAILISVTMTACFGKGKIAEEIETLRTQLSETDISALKRIPMKKLRVAHDSKNGALYYAGLLWYLNEEVEYAEVAWKRSAKTSQSIWKDESTRLVCYLLTRESRYNQIIPFVDSVLSPQQILEDPEIFVYYTRALWAIKDFDALSLLLQKQHKFRTTLRSRISVEQAEFHYDMWTAIMNIVTSPNSAEHNLALLFSKYSYQYTDSDFQTFLLQIPRFNMDMLSDHIQALVQLRNPEITEIEAFDILVALPLEYYQNYWVTLDLLDISNNLGSTYTDKATTLFEKAKALGTDNTSRGILTLAQADIAYKRNKYKKSTVMYKDGLLLIDYSTQQNEKNISSFLRRSQWRYLYSIIKTDSDAFFPLYIETIQNTSTPNYFTDLLEEQLSSLLQQNKRNEIKRQFFTYAKSFTDINQRAELLRWETIMAQIDPTFVIDVTDVRSFPRYYSSTPFDYLMNHEGTMTQDLFISDWVEDNVINTTPQSDVDTLINGYIEYGLIDYGYSIALENITQLSHASIQTISQALYDHGLVSQSLTLLRIAVSYNKKLLTTPNILKQLYPIPYFDILEKITKNPIEQAIMLGLMREESSFDHDARSHANAIGLTQMLQTTAEDISARINFAEPVHLTNPTTNITLGYWYFKYLIKVLDTPLKAIASYNGGLGNVWKWEKKYDDSNLILFADSLPFSETRNYIRKVASSAMIYGLLYFDISPEDFQKFLLNK